MEYHKQTPHELKKRIIIMWIKHLFNTFRNAIYAADMAEIMSDSKKGKKLLKEYSKHLVAILTYEEEQDE